MAAFACYFWWFVFGILLGWLLNWLLTKLLRKDPPSGTSYSPSRAVSAPVVASPKPAGSRVDLDAARRSGFSLRNADDIAVIDGIGPKIEELFRQHGVTTFAQIASMSVPQLQQILDAGGANFKLANPASWAEQARLIMSNRWADLKALHTELAAVAKAAGPHKP